MTTVASATARMDTNTPELSTQLKRFIPFEAMPAVLVETLATASRCVSLEPGDVLFEQTRPVDDACFLLSGQVDLVRGKHDVSRLNGDAYENFMALDSGHTHHRITVVASTACLFVVINRRYLELMTTWADIARSHDLDLVLGRGDWLVKLMACHVFERIPAGNIQELLLRFEERAVNAGDVVVCEGDVGDEFYVIKQGQAQVTRSTLNESLSMLSDGDMFGEDALISDLPRNATVTMTSFGELMVLPKQDFIELMKQPTLQYITPEKLELLIRHSSTGVVLVDVRQPKEMQFDPVLPARNIPLFELRQRLPGLTKDYCYVVIGEGRGEAAAYIMSEAGYRVQVLVGSQPG